MTILYITNQDPNGVGGGEFASHAFLRAFSEISGGDIDVCLADFCRDMDSQIKVRNIYRVPQRSKPRRFLSLFTGELHRYTDVVRNLLHNRNYDMCVLDHSLLCGTLIPIVKKKCKKVVVIHHNFEREYFKDNITKPFFRTILLPKFISSERKGYKNSDYNLFLTEDDLTKSELYYGATTSRNAVIGTFEYQDCILHVCKSHDLKPNDLKTYVITGSMNYPQGIDGIMYFLKELYPYIPKTSHVIIAGKSPVQEIKRLCERYPNVELIPNPRDMNEVLQRGDIYICPTREGGGLKLRIMDGLKHGIPIITHRCSSRGYEKFFDTSFFRIFNDSDDFKSIIESLEKSSDKNLFNKEDIIKQYQEYFSFNAGKSRIERILSENSNL